jgi:phage-related protein
MATIDLAEYQYKLTLDDSEYTTNMNKADSLADNMKTKLSNVGGFLKGALAGGLVAAGVAIAGTIAEGVKQAAGLEEQMSKFQSATGASAKEVEEVQNLAKDLYKTNTASMEDIVATSEAMVKNMGMNTDEVAKYQQSYMDYAKTTGQANTDVIGAIDDIGDAWGLTSEESAKSLDMLKKSNEEYGTDIVAVQDALTKAAPAAKALGMSMEETNGYMNLFAASGLDANQAVTAFTYASKQVKNPEEFKSMLADISAISDPTERAQAAVELFGSKAGVAMANVPTDQLSDFIVTMDEASGTVTNASSAFDSNFNVQLELMKKQFSGLTIEIGEKLMPVINTVLTWVTANMPTIVSVIGTAIDFISSILSPVIGVIQNVFGAFTSGQSETSTAFSGIQTTISTVIETIQSVISTFVTLFTTIWDKWGSDIVAFAQTYFTDIMNNIQNAFDFIQSIVETVTALLSGDFDGFFSGIQKIAQTGWDLISGIFKTVLDVIGGLVSAAFEVIKTVISTIFNGIKDKISDIWEKIKTNVSTAFEKVVDTIKNLPSKIWEKLVEVVTKIVTWKTNLETKAKEAAKALFDAIVDKVKKLPDEMLDVGKNLVKGIWNGINNAKDWIIDKIGGFTDSVVGSIKDFFGIHSPSTLMQDEVGKYVAQGIGVGFEDEMDNVNKQIQDSINTDFDVNSNLVGGITDSNAMNAIERSISNSYGDSTYSTPITVTYGDIIITGNADQNTATQIKNTLQSNTDDLVTRLKTDMNFRSKVSNIIGTQYTESTLQASNGY